MVNGPECAPHTLEEALSLWKQYNKVYFCYTQNFFNDTFNENQFLYMYIDSSLFVFLYYIIRDTHLSFFHIIPIIPKNRCDIPHFL